MLSVNKCDNHKNTKTKNMKVFRGSLVLTDADSEIGPAIIVVDNGKIVEVVKGSTNLPESLANVDQVNIQSKTHTQVIRMDLNKRSGPEQKTITA